MPTISMFYGIVIYMYYIDNKKHNKPHIHAHYAEDVAVVAIEDGEILEGALPKSKIKLVLAWVEIRKDELMADWQLAIKGEQIFRIDPLR